MADLPSDTSNKKRSIDDIIEHMTADLQSYEGQYILLGPPPSAAGSGGGGGRPMWAAAAHQPQPQPQPQPQSQTTQPQLFYHRPDTAEMIGMMDVGGGNFVNVVFSKPPSQEYSTHQVGFIYQQPPQNIVQPQNLMQPHLIDYGQRPYGESTTNGCLIENVVGNWAPNLNGTYSPFGSLPKDENTTKVSSSITCNQPASAPVKKQRIVAEVKPMRPSYSDVLAKSPPLTPPPTIKQATKPVPNLNMKIESGKRQQGKSSNCNLHNNKQNSSLKRQSSSGSDDGLGNGKNLKGMGDRWSSLEDLVPSPPLKPQSNVEESLRKRRKHRSTKSVSEKEEKFESNSKLSDSSSVNTSKKVQRSASPSTSGSKNCSSQTLKAPTERLPTKPKQLREKEKVRSKLDRGSNVSRNSNKTKRSQRAYKKREGSLGALWRKWQEQLSYYALFLTSWLVNLLWDVTAMSATLLIHLCGVVYEHSLNWASIAKLRIVSVLQKWKWWGKKEQRFAKKPEVPPLPGSLTHNIVLPTTGEEAMKRLLSCKGKDPYSILGVTSNCTDEEIKKYYKSQALLVHPDKNSQPGAEEAFKILVHAFDLIAEPDKRAAYDRYVAETNQVEQAWSELSDLLSQLHEKMEYAANTIRCNNCGKRHKREITERPSYAARYCAQCKIHHAAKEGDMWAESRAWGWGCKYYACMGGAVYEITQWANCQGGGVQRVKPDAHSVQYRVLLGRQQPPQSVSPEPDIEDLLNSLYSPNGSSKRGKKKTKKSK